MLIDSIHTFHETELESHEAEVGRTGKVPPERSAPIEKRTPEMNFCAPNLPTDIGGGSLDYRRQALFERELGKTKLADKWLKMGRSRNGVPEIQCHIISRTLLREYDS